MLAGNAQRLGNTILDLRGVSAAVGARTLFRGLTLHMVSGQRIGIIGKNGVGKTTLLKLVSGEEKPVAGEVVYGGHARTYPERQYDRDRDRDPQWQRTLVRFERAQRGGHGAGVVSAGHRRSTAAVAPAPRAS